LFGRAQALRKLEKWREARTDYTALVQVNAAWAYALAGLCDMQLNDYQAALSDSTNAHTNGQRDTSFLFNLARTQTRLQRHSEAARTYTEILSIEPGNPLATRNRAIAGMFVVINQKNKLPSDDCLADAEAYCRLADSSFEGPMVAAIVFGEAARKDKRYEAKAVEYLTEAIKKGFPLEAVSAHPAQLKPLLARVGSEVIAAGVHDSKYRVNFLIPVQEYSDVANWNRFLQAGKFRRSVIVRVK